MKCNASPTTCSAAELPQPSERDDREAARAFEALLATTVMKPVAESMGPLGSMLGDVFARAALGSERPT